ncbi:MAG: asparagine synthase (glutamine-hydrolyzing) [Myxococcales bacterium]
MCGILGFVTDRPSRLEELDRAAAIAALRHRGPDGEGTFEDLGSPAAVLLHTRLAILDPTPAGRQPMATADGRHVVSYNGEIYNYRELRAELAALGHRFVTDCDTEVLLAAFSEWGEGCLPRLRGMFAFGLWDRRERRLTLARDRLGIRPLYLHETAGGLAFASEVRALLQAGLAPRRLSQEGLVSFLAFGSVWGPQSIVEGVRELPPGTVATYAEGRLIQRRYWELPQAREGGPKTTDQAAEAVAPVLDEAVRLQLRSDVPLGVFLSAGMDSSLLAALAKRALGKPPVTLTVSFEGPASEGPEAAAFARTLGSEHREVRITPEGLGRLVPEAVAAQDQPSVDGVNTWFVARAARQAGLKVSLSGLGGDELFAGYASFRRFGPLRQAGRWASPLARAGLQALAGHPFNSVPQHWKKGLAAVAAAGDPASTYAALRALLLAPQLQALLRRPVPPPVAEAPRGLDGDAVSDLSRLELSNYLRYTLLRDTDALALAHGLEVRPPLLDEKLVEAVLPLPGALKLASDGNKPLLARAAREPYPHRPKSGFTLPFEQWLSGSLAGWAEEGRRSAPFEVPGDAIWRQPTARTWSWVFAPVVLGHWMREQHVQ